MDRGVAAGGLRTSPPKGRRQRQRKCLPGSCGAKFEQDIFERGSWSRATNFFAYRVLTPFACGRLITVGSSEPVLAPTKERLLPKALPPDGGVGDVGRTRPRPSENACIIYQQNLWICNASPGLATGTATTVNQTPAPMLTAEEPPTAPRHSGSPVRRPNRANVNPLAPTATCRSRLSLLTPPRPPTLSTTTIRVMEIAPLQIAPGEVALANTIRTSSYASQELPDNPAVSAL